MTTKFKDLIVFFKAVANEERLEIVKLLLKNNEMMAQSVEKHFFLEQSTTSHHLNTLRRAGITNTRKCGRNVYYSINYDYIKGIMDNIHNVFSKYR